MPAYFPLLQLLKRRNYFLLLLFFLSSRACFSQTVELSYDPKDNKQSILISRNPERLVNALTKDKNSDKEKFDAIFAWVASNIRYDFRSYYSTSGAGKPNIKRVLKKKRGICLDYAGLMDSLCELAGIKNFSVYGYAKEETFDVGDSIYVDNHAWNAVRLDGLWYVYDVTWASGAVEFYYTKRSRILLRLIGKFKPRTRTKTIKGWKKKDVCFKDNTYKSEPQKISWKTYRFNWLRNLLLRVSVRVKSKQGAKIDSTFYLSDPRTFALTHYPDDPAWALNAQEEMRDFESDSGYYHLNDSVYIKQQRQGYTCPECDRIAGSDELKFHVDLKKSSTQFNPRNHFAPSMCEAIIARNYFLQALNTDDSLKKMIALDSSFANMGYAKKSLTTANADVGIDYRLQQDKNRQKTKLLKEDNDIHSQFIGSMVAKTSLRIKNSRSHIKKRQRLEKKYVDRNKKLAKLKTAINVKNTNIRPDTAAVNLLKRAVLQKEKSIDSLEELANQYRAVFDKLSPQLKESTRKKVNESDSLFRPYYQKYSYRWLLLDDYRKPVVEARKKLHLFEKAYSDELDSNLYAFADSVIRISDRIALLVEERNKAGNDLFQLKAKQVKGGTIPLTDLLVHKQQLLNDNLDDFCWLRSGHVTMGLVYGGFNLLKYYQKYVRRILKNETGAEWKRYSYVAKELQRKSKKYRNVVSANKAMIREMEKDAKTHKKEYLKKLKEEWKKKN